MNTTAIIDHWPFQIWAVDAKDLHMPLKSVFLQLFCIVYSFHLGCPVCNKGQHVFVTDDEKRVYCPDLFSVELSLFVESGPMFVDNYKWSNWGKIG